MSKRCGLVLAAVIFAAAVATPSAEAGDAFLKVGVTLSDVGGFTDRWFVSAGTDWGVSEMGYFGMEIQGAYRSNRAVGPVLIDSAPANFFLNGKWKSPRHGVRPYAGAGFGLVSAFVWREVAGVRTSQYVKDGGFQMMGGVELNERWVLELNGLHVFAEGAEFRWSLLGGVRW